MDALFSFIQNINTTKREKKKAETQTNPTQTKPHQPNSKQTKPKPTHTKTNQNRDICSATVLADPQTLEVCEARSARNDPECNPHEHEHSCSWCCEDPLCMHHLDTLYPNKHLTTPSTSQLSRLLLLLLLLSSLSPGHPLPQQASHHP